MRSFGLFLFSLIFLFVLSRCLKKVFFTSSSSSFCFSLAFSEIHQKKLVRYPSFHGSKAQQRSSSKSSSRMSLMKAETDSDYDGGGAVE